MATDTTSALADAARSAGQAPSVLNTQPWHWRVHDGVLELSGVGSRRLQAFDPSSKQLTISCGAALHHARVALAAEGFDVDIDRLPDGPGTDLLARLAITGRIEVTPAALRQLDCTRTRQTDRRPVPDVPVPDEHIDRLRLAVEREHAWLHTLRRDDAFDLATAASQAAQMEEFGPTWRSELDYWAGGPRDGGLGVPTAALPEERPRTLVSNVDYGRTGELVVNTTHDQAAVYAILYGEATEYGWLRGGEALSAVWLTATELGMSLLPLSSVVEVPATRQILSRLLSQLGEPYLVLRFGMSDAGSPSLIRTPRLPAEETVTVD